MRTQAELLKECTDMTDQGLLSNQNAQSAFLPPSVKVWFVCTIYEKDKAMQRSPLLT